MTSLFKAHVVNYSLPCETLSGSLVCVLVGGLLVLSFTHRCTPRIFFKFPCSVAFLLSVSPRFLCWSGNLSSDIGTIADLDNIITDDSSPARESR
ncbi:uncharacterized protein BT62DRAFT_366905 [Guyanagaster necrorhizus]|uniref:Uncharacterized protein n=1 Tax=Guyanagaster necrorhizus TaxID=856835 RepID=A0A9P7VLD5_9AGAR|nr:uncharacterized protein BT62DRAFT_366905 [Guyanagaster necrorhizus MCA 3950]KAG7442675.1 hypothetical protein BT62DRAFT_366905 [Guyanagaster necrorhizus MCA 3950]